jgi:hypothetical protein
MDIVDNENFNRGLVGREGHFIDEFMDIFYGVGCAFSFWKIDMQIGVVLHG